MKAEIRMSGRALVTGGTRGLGEAIARRLAVAGMEVAVTHRWGTVPEELLAKRWADLGLPAPLVIEADAGEPEDTDALVDRIASRMGGLELVVANAAVGGTLRDLGAFDVRTAELTLQKTAWPLLDLARACEQRLPKLPERFIAISSLGASLCPEGYAYIGAAKAALEASCRYLAAMLGPKGVRANVLRYGYLDTEGLGQVFGEEERGRLRAAGAFLPLDEAADAALALASGLLDAVNGQVIVVDGGAGLLPAGGAR